MNVRRLGRSLLDVGDKVVSIFLLLETTEGHLGAWNVLLWVLEVLEQSVLVPSDTLSLVSVSVVEALDLARLSTNHTVKVWANLVSTTSLDGVALQTTSLEQSSTLLFTSYP